MLQIPECCTSFNAGVLEELILTMINKELMVRGETVRQEKSLQMLLGNKFAAIKDQIADLQREKNQMDVSKDEVYQEYASGKITPEEYRARADELDRQTGLLSGQLRERQEKLFVLEEEQEKLEADMKQIDRKSVV